MVPAVHVHGSNDVPLLVAHDDLILSLCDLNRERSADVPDQSEGLPRLTIESGRGSWEAAQPAPRNTVAIARNTAEAIVRDFTARVLYTRKGSVLFLPDGEPPTRFHLHKERAKSLILSGLTVVWS
jgi:hypothetical protein